MGFGAFYGSVLWTNRFGGLVAVAPPCIGPLGLQLQNMLVDLVGQILQFRVGGDDYFGIALRQARWLGPAGGRQFNGVGGGPAGLAGEGLGRGGLPGLQEGVVLRH